MSKRIRKDDVTRKMQLKDCDFLKQVLPEAPKPTVQKFVSRDPITTTTLLLL